LRNYRKGEEAYVCHQGLDSRETEFRDMQCPGRTRYIRSKPRVGTQELTEIVEKSLVLCVT
jgi:hypothetical protein